MIQILSLVHINQKDLVLSNEKKDKLVMILLIELYKFV